MLAISNRKVKEIFSFPAEVNQRAVRTVAAGVVLLTALALITGWPALSAILALGFWLRVISGPTLSPLGQLATRVIAPRLGSPEYTAGRPKRFAQLLGALAASAALGLILGGYLGLGRAVLAGLLLLSALEALAGWCLGCRLFRALIAIGLLPEEGCQRCQQ